MVIPAAAIEQVHGISLTQIETFFWAARLGSFAKTAKHLNATQSAISMRIQELEARLDVVLFDRSQRSAQLTSEGLHLLPLAEQVLASAARLIQTASGKEPVAGYVRLGVTEVIALTWFPQFVDALRRRYPRIQWEIEVALSYVLEDKLNCGALDMAFTPCELSQARFLHTSLEIEPFRWMCSPSLPGIPDRVSPAEFMTLPLITTSRELQLRGSILRWINENRISFRTPTICNTFTIAGNMAAAGMGVAFLPLRIYERHLRDGLLRIVECEPAIEGLEHFSVRPLAENSPVHAAIEEVAVEIGQLASHMGPREDATGPGEGPEVR